METRGIGQAWAGGRWALSCLALSACSVDGSGSADSAPGPRDSLVAQKDVRAVDAARPTDGPPDAGGGLDAGFGPDVRSVDAASLADGPPDAGVGPDVRAVDAARPPDGPPDAAPLVCTHGEIAPCLTECGEGVQRCVDGGWSSCAAPPEECNGLDDDCNGLVDEGRGCPERIGNPTWRVGDFTIVSIDYGSAGDNFAGFFGLMERVLAPFHRAYPAQRLGIGPGLSHETPYAEEFGEALVAEGYEPGTTFALRDWLEPRGLIFVTTLVPIAGAPVGASPDFASGPIIPGGVTVDGDLFLDGVLVDPDFDTIYPAVSTLTPRPVGDGHSHIPLFFGESTAFIPGVGGDYEFRLRVRDERGNGWDARQPFTITEPVPDAETVPVTSYDIDATPGSGFGCWAHVYSGEMRPSVPPRTVGGSVMCSPGGGVVFDYRGGSGSLNDGDLGTSHLFVNGRPDGANVSIDPVITLYLAAATTLREIDLHGGWGVLTHVTVERGGVAAELVTRPFGDLTAQGEARHFRLEFSGTALEDSVSDRVVLRGFNSTFLGAPLDQFGLSEIELKRPRGGLE